MIKVYPKPSPLRVVFGDTAIECTHKFRLTRMDCTNGTYQVRMQCSICGKSGEAQKHDSTVNASALPVYDRDLSTRYYQERHTEKQVELQKQNAAWWAWYAEYLQSSIWQERRRAVMLRAQGICEACRSEQATEIHHLSYANVGQEPLFELAAVCKNCHNHITERNRTP